MSRRRGGAPSPGARFHAGPEEALHGGSLVRVRRALPCGRPHGAEPQRVVPDQGHHVDAEPLIDGVHVLREALPVPGQHGGEGLHRQVLDAAEGGEHRLAVLGLQWRQGEPAVARQNRGDTVPHRGRAELVPERLRVVVRVQIDDPRRDEEPIGIDGRGRRAPDLPDLHDRPVLDRHVGPIARKSRPVDDHPVPDHEVVRHDVPGLRRLDTGRCAARGRGSSPCGCPSPSAPRR